MIKFIFSILISVFSLEVFSLDIEQAIKKASSDGVRVYEVSRKTEKTGNIQTTTVEFMFENTTDRILESEFEFPLDENESVVGYALDINGKMRKGVVVEKDKGRKVFEEIVRRGVDPGIVEMTQGNNFKTRVYPINPHGTRHLEITAEKEIFGKDAEKGKVRTQTTGKDTFFYYYDEISVAAKQKQKPRSIAVLWDASASGEKRNIKEEIEFLNVYAASLENSKIQIVPFCNEVLESAKFEGNSKTDLKKMSDFLESLNYDGATSFAFDFDSFEADEIFIFSDGLENWKNAGAKIQKSKKIVNTICSAKSADFDFLKKIARENGGTFVNLRENSSDEAISILSKNPLRLIKAEFSEKEISDFFPQNGEEIKENGFSVSGILKKKKAKITLHFGFGNETVEKKTIEVSAVNSEDSPIVERLWASKKIAALSASYEKNRTEIISLSKKYGVVTKETSLIVLENLSDYVRYEIEPPEELREEYNRLVQRNRPKATSEKSGIPQIIFTTFQTLRDWWKKSPSDWKKEKEKKEKEKIELEKRARTLQMKKTDGLMMWSNSVNSVQDFAPVRKPARNSQKSAGSARKLERNFEVEEAAAAPMLEDSKIAVEDSEIAVEEAMEFARSAQSADSAESRRETPNSGKIALQEWKSDSPYLAILKKTASEEMYKKYLELKKEYKNSPAFFMEVSDYFSEEDLPKESIRILSNLCEMNLENTDILRALGYKLFERGFYDFALPIFEKLIKLRPEVPQFHRDFALCAEAAGRKQEAVDHLWKIASQTWDARYSEIWLTALNDMNSIIARSKRKEIDISKIDSKLQENLDTDIRVVLTWNTDDCDIDLWVTDPNGEKCFYGHKFTEIGGRMSRDFTQGYGPEEFLLRNAIRGKYKIEANYFGTRKQSILQPVVVQAEVYTNFGRENQKREILTLQLKDVRGTFLVGEIEF